MFKGNYWRKPTTKTTTATKIPVHFHLFFFFFFSFETEIAKLKPCGCINFLFFCTFGSHGLRQCVFSCPSHPWGMPWGSKMNHCLSLEGTVCIAIYKIQHTASFIKLHFLALRGLSEHIPNYGNDSSNKPFPLTIVNRLYCTKKFIKYWYNIVA